MNKNLVICLILLVAASLSTRFREPPAQHGFSIHGVALGWPDERVERLVGKELAGSICPQGGAHQHFYEDGLYAVLDDTGFLVRGLSGNRLELDGQVILQAGDSVQTVTEPFLTEIPLPLENGARLVARPIPDGYFDENPEFGWHPTLAKGYDQAFRVGYRYQSDDGTMTDCFDFDLHILAYGGRVKGVTLHWMGH